MIIIIISLTFGKKEERFLQAVNNDQQFYFVIRSWKFVKHSKKGSFHNLNYSYPIEILENKLCKEKKQALQITDSVRNDTINSNKSQALLKKKLKRIRTSQKSLQISKQSFNIHYSEHELPPLYSHLNHSLINFKTEIETSQEKNRLVIDRELANQNECGGEQRPNKIFIEQIDKNSQANDNELQKKSYQQQSKVSQLRDLSIHQQIDENIARSNLQLQSSSSFSQKSSKASAIQNQI